MLRKTQAEFLEDVKGVGVEVLGVYVGALRKVRVRCLRCDHVWDAVANNLVQGHGCRICGAEHIRGLNVMRGVRARKYREMELQGLVDATRVPTESFSDRII